MYEWIQEGTISEYNEKKLNNELRVAVRENDISESIAKSNFKGQRFVYVPQLTGTLDLLNFVAEDKADVTFVEPYLANHFNESSSAKIVEVDKNKPVRIYENTFIFLKDDLSLKEVFDREIEVMREDGSLKDLISKYRF